MLYIRILTLDHFFKALTPSNKEEQSGANDQKCDHTDDYTCDGATGEVNTAAGRGCGSGSGGGTVENCRCGFFGYGLADGECEVGVAGSLDLGSEGLRAVRVYGADHQFTNAGVGRSTVEEYGCCVVDCYVVVGDLEMVRRTSCMSLLKLRSKEEIINELGV